MLKRTLELSLPENMEEELKARIALIGTFTPKVVELFKNHGTIKIDSEKGLVEANLSRADVIRSMFETFTNEEELNLILLSSLSAAIVENYNVYVKDEARKTIGADAHLNVLKESLSKLKETLLNAIKSNTDGPIVPLNPGDVDNLKMDDGHEK